jgi:hypothetical protein
MHVTSYKINKNACYAFGVGNKVVETVRKIRPQAPKVPEKGS